MDAKVRAYLKNNSQKGYILKRITVSPYLKGNSRMEIKGNSRILQENSYRKTITGKLVTLNWYFNSKKSI